MIPTPPAPPGYMPSQHHHGQTSRSVPQADLDADEEYDPYADELQEEEEMAEDEELGHADPRGELAEFIHITPRSDWPRDQNGKYWLLSTGKG